MSWSLSERLYLYCICNVLLHLSAMIVGCTCQLGAGAGRCGRLTERIWCLPS